MSDVPKTSIYHKTVPVLTIDVYRVLRAFEVHDPNLAHAIKKLLCAGKRIGGKSLAQDVHEAIWTLTRWEEMRAEEQPVARPRRPRTGEGR